MAKNIIIIIDTIIDYWFIDCFFFIKKHFYTYSLRQAVSCKSYQCPCLLCIRRGLCSTVGQKIVLLSLS